MTSFFTSVTNFFASLWDTVTLIFQAIKEIVLFLVNLFGFIGAVFSALPVYIYVALIVVVALFVVYKIVGR